MVHGSLDAIIYHTKSCLEALSFWQYPNYVIKQCLKLEDISKIVLMLFKIRILCIRLICINFNATTFAYGLLGAPMSQTDQLKLDWHFYNSLQDLKFGSAPNEHNFNCNNLCYQFIWCAMVGNLGVEIGIAFQSVTVLKVLKIWNFKCP